MAVFAPLQIVSNELFNKYPDHESPYTKCPGVYTEGDFLLHFPGEAWEKGKSDETGETRLYSVLCKSPTNPANVSPIVMQGRAGARQNCLMNITQSGSTDDTPANMCSLFDSVETFARRVFSCPTVLFVSCLSALRSNTSW